MSFSRRILIAGALALLSSASAFATVVIGQSIEEMTVAAPFVLRGKVGQVQTRWDDAHRTINTYAEVAVTELLKGRTSNLILVRQPGGVVGDLGMAVSGAAQFYPGEDVVLFLEPAVDEPAVFGVWSLAAGKVSVAPSLTGEARAQRDLEGVSFYERSAKSSPGLHRIDREADLGTVSSFLRRVRTAAAKAGGR